jgi:hypothetical protein
LAIAALFVECGVPEIEAGQLGNPIAERSDEAAKTRTWRQTAGAVFSVQYRGR